MEKQTNMKQTATNSARATKQVFLIQGAKGKRYSAPKRIRSDGSAHHDRVSYTCKRLVWG